MKKIYTIFSFLFLAIAFNSNAQCSTPSTVPYYEGFQTITVSNQLPPCWAISNPSFCITTAGSIGFASFYYQPAATNYFYTNAIQLSAGVVYSISVWYNTGFNSTTTWSDLSLLLCQNQSAVGAVTVASTNGFAIANGMSNLSNTFTVSSSGNYYIAVKGTSNGTGTSQYLSWDDLSITIPCSVAPNSPSIAILASSTVICAGTTPTFIATGANTYSWNNGSTNSTTSYTFPMASVMSGVQVIGTNTLTGCSSTASITISVNETPNVIVYANNPWVCKGSSGIITAFGASSYTWSTGQQTNSISVSPSVSTVYTVTGSNNFGCTSTAVHLIQVYPLPTLTVLSAMPSNTICNGDLDTLNVSGANSYTWTYSQSLLTGSQIIVTPSVTTSYTIIGQDNIGCSSQTIFVLNVNECTGLNHIAGTNYEIKIFPNPFQDEFLVSTGTQDTKSIVTTDLSGRIILDIFTNEESLIVNTRYYAPGIYYVKIKSEEGLTILKMLKN